MLLAGGLLLIVVLAAVALWFSFANYDKPRDRDIASYGVVRMLDESSWEPKKIFHAMSSRYGHVSRVTQCVDAAEWH